MPDSTKCPPVLYLAASRPQTERQHEYAIEKGEGAEDQHQRLERDAWPGQRNRAKDDGEDSVEHGQPPGARKL